MSSLSLPVKLMLTKKKLVLHGIHVYLKTGFLVPIFENDYALSFYKLLNGAKPFHCEYL